MGEVDIGEEALYTGTNEMESGLNEVSGGLLIREGDEGWILGNGKPPRGPNRGEKYGITTSPKRG